MTEEEQSDNYKMEKRAYKLQDCVYHFNPKTMCVSNYELRKDGFAFVVTCYDESKYKSFELVLMRNKNAREITLKEFTEFVKKLEVLQDQAHAFKPLVSFDDYIQLISFNHGLNPK